VDLTLEFRMRNRRGGPRFRRDDTEQHHLAERRCRCA
jgi:hypothetical protein